MPTTYHSRADYPVDVTAIAECRTMPYPRFSIYVKLETIPNSRFIRLGNYANRVVDDLLSAQSSHQLNHLHILKNDFIADPIAYSTCFDLSDKDRLKSYVQDAKNHFNTIKQVITKRFESLDIHQEGISLEPSFISSNYGIQGRLDILYQDKDGTIRIIELKSSTLSRRSKKCQNQSPSTAILYYLLVSDTLSEMDRKDYNIQGYILYSKSTVSPLRFDAPNNQRIGRIFDMRNQIVWMERQLSCDDHEWTDSLFEKLIQGSFSQPIPTEVQSYFTATTC